MRDVQERTDELFAVFGVCEELVAPVPETRQGAVVGLTQVRHDPLDLVVSLHGARLIAHLDSR